MFRQIHSGFRLQCDSLQQHVAEIKAKLSASFLAFLCGKACAQKSAMNLSIVPLPISVACFCWLPVAGFAEIESQELRCGQAALWRAPIDSSHYRKYAPDRKVDILHLALDVTPDFKQRTIAGQATLRFKPLAQPLEELQLDGI